MTYQLGSSPNEQMKGIAEWRAWWQTACEKDKKRWRVRRGDAVMRYLFQLY